MGDQTPARVRTKEPCGGQTVIRFEMPEDTLPDHHVARLLWRVAANLGGSGVARGGHGRAERPSNPMLLLRGLYARAQRIGTGREIARRSRADAALRWIVGDPSVGHTLLSEPRLGHREGLDTLYSDVVASPVHKDLL